jgi:hypothetical protein
MQRTRRISIDRHDQPDTAAPQRARPRPAARASLTPSELHALQRSQPLPRRPAATGEHDRH